MKKLLVLAIALLAVSTVLGAECAKTGLVCEEFLTEDGFVYGGDPMAYWACVVVNAPSLYLPIEQLADFAQYDRADGCWIINWDYSFDQPVVWEPDYKVQAGCGGGCAIQNGLYWLPAYQAYSG